MLVARNSRDRVAISSRRTICNLKSNFPGGVAAHVYEPAHYGRVTLGTSTSVGIRQCIGNETRWAGGNSRK